jgi:WD40 repeat protein
MDHDSDGVYRNVYNFHKGSIEDLVCSPTHNYAMSLGEDGLVKVWDYAKKDQMDCYDQKYYDGEGTCLAHMPHTDANKGRLCAIGFSNGIVRIVSVTADHLSLLKAFKAHDEAIVAMKFSRDLRLLVTASAAGNIFFFELDPHSDIQKFEPLCTVKLPDEAQILDFKWDPEDQMLFFGCKNGRVYEVQRPNPKKIDNSDTYYWHDAQFKMWEIKLMESQMEKNQKKDEAEEEKKRRMRLRGELPPEDEEPEEVWEPMPIRTILPYKNEVGKTEFIVSSEGKFNGLLYVCQMDEERPLRGIEIKPDVFVTRMELHETDKPGETLLTICYDDGDVELIIDHNWDKRMSVRYHDVHTGQVTSAQFSNKQCNFFLTSGRDGLIYVHQFDKTCAVEEAKLDPLANVEGANFLPAKEKEDERVKQLKKYANEHQAVFPPIDDDVLLDEASLAISLKLTEPTEVDADAAAYSIQQSKLRTEEDHRLSLAEKKKEKVRA